jgi:hypothetical protein
MTRRLSNAFQTDGQDSRWHCCFDAQAQYFDLGSGENRGNHLGVLNIKADL